MSNSTLSGNSTLNKGDGIFNIGTLLVSKSTLSGNSAGDGGIFNPEFSLSPNRKVSVVVSSSIVGGNHTSGSELSNQGDFVSYGYNLMGRKGNAEGFITAATDVVLQRGIETAIAPLASNSGATFTYALVAGSPALNAANPNDCPQPDQRGISRTSRSI